MPHDAFSFELLLALSRTPQTAEAIRRKLSDRGVRAPLRSIQTKLERLAEYPRYPIVIDRSSAPFTYAWRERAPAVTVPGEDEAQRLLSALSRAFAAKRQPLYRDSVPLERRIDRFPVILEESDESSEKISPLIFSRVLAAVREQRLIAVTVLFEKAPVRRGRFLRPLGLAVRPAGFALIAVDEENRSVRVELPRLESVKLLPSYLPLPDGVETNLERAAAAAVPL